MTVPVPTARALRRRLRATRPRRTAAGLLERAVYTVFGGALAFGAVRAGSRRIGGLAVTSPDTAVTRPLGAVLAVLALVLLARALLAIGPLYAGAAERTWLLGAPVDRGRLLTGQLAAATAAGATRRRPAGGRPAGGRAVTRAAGGGRRPGGRRGVRRKAAEGTAGVSVVYTDADPSQLP